jgi:hypothetical protein
MSGAAAATAAFDATAHRCRGRPPLASTRRGFPALTSGDHRDNEKEQP